MTGRSTARARVIRHRHRPKPSSLQPSNTSVTKTRTPADLPNAERGWRHYGLVLRGAAGFALGEIAAARAAFQEAAGVLRGMIAEREDLRPSLSAPNDHPIAPIVKFSATDLPQRDYDPDKARFHLKKAGLEGHSFTGFPLIFWDVYREQGHPVRTTITRSRMPRARTVSLNRR